MHFKSSREYIRMIIYPMKTFTYQMQLLFFFSYVYSSALVEHFFFHRLSSRISLMNSSPFLPLVSLGNKKRRKHFLYMSTHQTLVH